MNIIEITSLSQPGIELFATLTEAQLRNRLEPLQGVFIAESPKVIRVALQAGYQPVALLCEKRHITGDAADIIQLVAGVDGLPIYTGSRELLAQLTGYTLTRGVLCAFRRPPLPSVAEVCKDSRRVVVIEGVVDTTNIGAIFRSAAALGIDAVLLTPNSCDPLNRRAVRVSMGSVFLVPWTWLPESNATAPVAGTNQQTLLTAAEDGAVAGTNQQSLQPPPEGGGSVAGTNQKSLQPPPEGGGSVAGTNQKSHPTSAEGGAAAGSYQELLRQLGFRTAAMALSDNSISISDARLKAEPRLAIIMGTEGDGLPSTTISSADYVVRIPMSHHVDSLNVAAASAVAFWELRP